MINEDRINAVLNELNDQVGEWGNAIMSYDGQAAVIVGATYVEQRLEALLRVVFADIKLGESLLEDARTLGSFSAKIDLAKAIGLVDSETASRLHCVRKVRNDAAHSDHSYKLETAQNFDRVAAFIGGELVDKVAKKSVRVRFFVLCMQQVAVLTAHRLLIETLISNGFETAPGRILPEISRGAGDQVVENVLEWAREVVSDPPELPQPKVTDGHAKDDAV